MAVDDSEDKLRRNVVTFSALIIIASFLGLNITESFPVFGQQLAKVSPFKFWIVVTVVLIYILLRHHFDGAGRVGRRNLADEYKYFRGPKMRAALNTEITRLLVGGNSSAFFPDPNDLHKEYLNIYAKASATQSPTVKFEVFKSVDQQWNWDGETQTVASFAYETSATPTQEYFQAATFYRFPTGRRIQITLFAIYRTAIFSKSAVDVAVPYLLGAGALTVCVYRLFATSPYHFISPF